MDRCGEKTREWRREGHRLGRAACCWKLWGWVGGCGGATGGPLSLVLMYRVLLHHSRESLFAHRQPAHKHDGMRGTGVKIFILFSIRIFTSCFRRRSSNLQQTAFLLQPEETGLEKKKKVNLKSTTNAVFYCAQH